MSTPALVIAARNRVTLRSAAIGLLVSVVLVLMISSPRSPRAATRNPDVPQSAFFSYWSEDDGFRSAVVINNAGNGALTVNPFLYNLAGQPLVVSPIVLAPRQQITANVADWLAQSGAAPEFKQGNLILSYDAPDAAYLGAQVTVTDPASSLSFDFRDEMPMSFKSSRLEGMWWRPDGDSRYDLVLSNMKDDNVSVTVRASGGRAGEFSFDVSLMPHETQLIRLDDIERLPFTSSERVGKLGGISITHTGAPGAVVASGMLSKNETGFSSHFTFEDPATVRSHATIGSQVLAGTHLLLDKPDLPGFPDQSSFTSIALLRNASDSAIEVKPSVSFNSKGGPRTVSLPARVLAASQVEALNIGAELRRSGIRGAVTGCGLTLSSSGETGTLVAHLTSFDQTRHHVFDVPMKDPAISMNRFSGSYPWSIDDDHQSVIHVRNITDEKARATIQLDFDGGSYTLPLQVLEPQQEVAIDIRQLRDSETKDSIGRVIPSEVTHGQATWSERGRQALIGRVEVFSVSRGTSSSFSCSAPCCPPDTESIYITPGSFTGVVGDGGAAQAFELQQRDCDGAQFGPFDISFGAQWSSTNTQVATVNGAEVNCVGVGVADVNVSYWGTNFLYNTTTECCDEDAVPVFAQVPVTVLQPELVGVFASAVPGDNNAIISGQAFTLQIQARVPGSNPPQVVTSFNNPVTVSFGTLIAGESISQSPVPMSQGLGQTTVAIKVIDGSTAPSCCRTYALAASGATSTTAQVRVWFPATMDIERWKNCNFSSCPNLGSYFCTSSCVTQGFSSPFPFVALTADVCGANVIVRFTNPQTLITTSQTSTVLDVGPTTNNPYWNTGVIPSLGGCISDSLATQLGVPFGCNPNVGQGAILWRFQ